jgi:SAM-dependent methyltransferase
MIAIKKTQKFDFLREKIKDKLVLHVGCCGIVKKIELKDEKNNYLHKFLCDNSKIAYGLDNDVTEIDYLKSKGIENLFIGDAEKINEIDFDTKFDLILLGNVFNYFPNPGLLLNKTAELLNPGGTIIITIENPMSLKKIFRYVLFGKYPDMYHHLYSVNKNTLINLVSSSGFAPIDWAYHFEGPDNFLKQTFKSKLANKIVQLISRSDRYADGLIIEIKKKN